MAKTPKQKTMAENHKVGTVLATGLFLIICLLIAFPLVCGLLGSFRDGAKVITTGMSLDLHSPVSMQNYSELFAIFHPKGMPADVLETSRKYFMWYKNSLVLTLTTVVLTLLVCYFIAYGLSMYKFKLQGFLFFMVIATMSVPPVLPCRLNRIALPTAGSRTEKTSSSMGCVVSGASMGTRRSSA